MSFNAKNSSVISYLGFAVQLMCICDTFYLLNPCGPFSCCFCCYGAMLMVYARSPFVARWPLLEFLLEFGLAPAGVFAAMDGLQQYSYITTL
ncbi:hypothetical protein U1Q18_009715 [Sarracenia purpurea var. burkii]